MSKRNITKQQSRRIVKKSMELETYGQEGTVIIDFGHNVTVEDKQGNLIECKKRQHLGPIVAGDLISFANEMITAVKPRKNLLSRPDSRGKLHAVAANIDQMLIVVASNPAPQHTTIDRYLVSAQLLNIEPVLLFNKSDLEGHEKLCEIEQIYKQIGIYTLNISTKSKVNLDLLNELLKNKTSVFVGQSGVGKSSLIANFLPNKNIRVGEISDINKQGKHTTTNACLYHLEHQRGNIIDSPGMREFPLWQLEPSTLVRGFIEFSQFLDCKFSNCRHVNEPGCSLLVAAKLGKISNQRLASYHKLLNQMQDK